jgi:very-short-patch-repair endonuclease
MERENINYVKCGICGWKGRQITTSHLWLVHQIKAKDYKEMFPSLPMTCEETKTKIRNRIAPIQSEETKRKISETMKRVYHETDFPMKTQNQDQCGEKNPFYGKKHTEEFKKKHSRKTTKRLWEEYENGRVSPFKYLGIHNQPSQIEEMIEQQLSAFGFKFNYKIPFKKGAYYIDFALVESKIAIELDSLLHDLPKQKASDQRKDTLLESLGWKVFRVKFSMETNEEIFEKVKEILDENQIYPKKVFRRRSL